MSTRIACALYLACLALPALAQVEARPVAAQAATQDEAPAVQPEAAPARIVVSGRRPGPGVWKVSKGDHVMWVFGLYSPLPQKMEWDAARVERLVSQSQEVLLPPGARIEVGFFRGLTLLPGMLSMERNPDGARLQDLVPADVYARWSVLKQKYIGDDDGIERYRPMFAAGELLQAGMQKNGLSQGLEVRKQIEKIASKNRVRLTPSSISIEPDDPKRMLKEFKKGQMDDVACFTKTLERLEGDIDAMRVRANAWANGNIAEIRHLDFAERDEACNNAVLNSSFARNAPEFQSLRERMREAWLAAAEKALAGNASTFALLKMSNVFDPQGYLAALQARGYTVESPK